MCSKFTGAPAVLSDRLLVSEVNAYITTPPLPPYMFWIQQRFFFFAPHSLMLCRPICSIVCVQCLLNFCTALQRLIDVIENKHNKSRKNKSLTVRWHSGVCRKYTVLRIITATYPVIFSVRKTNTLVCVCLQCSCVLQRTKQRITFIPPSTNLYCSHCC